MLHRVGARRLCEFGSGKFDALLAGSLHASDYKFEIKGGDLNWLRVAFVVVVGSEIYCRKEEG